MTAIDDLYQVQDGVDDVVAADHNTLVLASQFLNDAFGGSINFGNGKDGNLKLGVISATTSTAPVATSGGSGNLTGTFYYKYTAYNLSGETLESSASATITLASGKANIQLAGTANNTNITGFHLYRSIDDVTYYRVGTFPLDDSTQSVTVEDNLPISSGTAPAGSNTTSVTGTNGGTFYCKDATFTSGQTLNVSNGKPLVIISNGDISLSGGGSIVGTASGLDFIISGQRTSVLVSDNGNNRMNAGGDANIGFNGGSTQGVVVITSEGIPYAERRWFFSPGPGGAGASSRTRPGSPIILIAKGKILLNSASIISNGGTSADGGGAGAGGTFMALAGEYIDRTGLTLTLNGGDSSNSGVYPTSGEGGGGVGCFVSDNIIGSATSTANAGAPGGGNGSGTNTGAGGGGNGGNGGGGANNTGTPPGNAAAGFFADFNLSEFSLGRL